MGDTVLYEVADAVGTITINRPEAMNALDTATKESLRDCVLQAADDPQVRAVLLTGSGRAFSVGQDLTEHKAGIDAASSALWRTVPDHYNPVVLALATMPKPVVAAVNGVAAGAGAAFAFACDFRILADTAGFNLAFTAIGLTADSGASWTLPRLVGRARATELLMRPSTITATQALEFGLANEVVPADEVLPRASELARDLAAGATVAYGAVKRSLAYAASHDLESTLVYESEQQKLAGGTEDHRNAVTAFIAKEKPRFTGR
ncbi:MAG: 2-(1,2-epoxy,2-dihydrophenyl)acetyl-CoA isomerase [Frankiales bacterium]|jgi:2-(1,2-epoxy-1,2-dihydrophenyl)acetyl-CoA isomerase|nr:2-(1,2-epoxy,2-dihydrophenyl)acetyl-CoA isomerase [Frankiales bacterium]